MRALLQSIPEFRVVGEATRRIVQTSPHAGVLILTMFQADDSVFAAMRAGARGYILKVADQDGMIRAIRAVASGEALFGPEIAKHLMNNSPYAVNRTGAS